MSIKGKKFKVKNSIGKGALNKPLGWKDVDCMECSACHDSWIIEEDYCFDNMPLWNYCPSCGAKMDGGAD